MIGVVVSPGGYLPKIGPLLVPQLLLLAARHQEGVGNFPFAHQSSLKGAGLSIEPSTGYRC